MASKSTKTVTNGKLYRFINSTKSTALATEAKLARSWHTRLRGLLFSKPLAQGQGLFLEPCNCIHMFGMTYAIDCVFVDKKNVVVGLVHNIGPGKMSAMFWKAESCLEVPPGTIERTNTSVGDQLLMESNGGA